MRVAGGGAWAVKDSAARAGFTIEEIINLTKIDRWFLVQIKEIVDFEEDLAELNQWQFYCASAAANSLCVV